jgi:hypothetical protein
MVSTDASHVSERVERRITAMAMVYVREKSMQANPTRRNSGYAAASRGVRPLTPGRLVPGQLTPGKL